MKICPICDHELVGMFCPSCRKMVSEPLILSDGIYLNKPHSSPDVLCEFGTFRRDFFLNRRHPANEKDCSYHEAGKTAFGGLKEPAGRKKEPHRSLREQLEVRKQELLQKYGADYSGLHRERPSGEDVDSLLDILKKNKGGNKT